jgi:hypothetical protein
MLSSSEEATVRLGLAMFGTAPMSSLNPYKMTPILRNLIKSGLSDEISSKARQALNRLGKCLNDSDQRQKI